MKHASFILASLIVAQTDVFAADPIAITDQTCLFLDDRFIAEQSGLSRTWHPAQPQPEPAIVEDVGKGKWERWPHMFGSTLYDPEAKLYRIYYESAIWPSRTPPNSFTTYVCYAESKDGKTWTKPMVRMFGDLGSKENNIVIHCAEFPKAFVDPLEKDPAARLKMFVYLNGTPPLMGGHGECLLSSGDGIQWKFVGGFNKPAYAKPEQGNFTDSYCFLFDSSKQRYMAYIRTFAKSHVAEAKDGRRRAVGISESTQINRGWTPIVQVLEPDSLDDEKVAAMSKDPQKPDWAEHYCMPFFPCGHHYIGMLSLLYFIDGSDSNGGGDLQLTFSHDGRTWYRHPERQTMIAPSNSAPELFPTYVSINGPVEVGNEWWLYYTEGNGAHPVAPPATAISQIRAAVWRKDGFVSLDAFSKGTLTTHPLKLEGNKLIVNVSTDPFGYAQLALLDESGKPIPGFEGDACDPISGDQIASQVTWKGKGDLNALSGKTVRLRFELSKGALWSFRAAKE